MRKVASILWVVATVAGLSVGSQAQGTLTPGWLRFFGDGSAGAFSCTSGSCILGDERWFTSFNVSAGATVVTTGQNGPIVIRSTGTCTVAGSMSDSPNSGAGITITGGGDFGGAGGGGGGGTAAGRSGLSAVADAGLVINSGGTAGAASGGSGGNGNSPVVSQYRLLLGGGTFWPVGGARGGQGGSNGGLGGYGGGPIILVCNTINFTGTIDVSGGPGGASPANNSGAGGGGGGGYVILSAINYTANTGTINTAGGPGGGCNSNTGCGAGGNGGNGWSVALTIQ
jgi:hypothetical protein